MAESTDATSQPPLRSKKKAREPRPGRGAGLVAIFGGWLICLFAVFSPGAPAAWSFGLTFTAAGLLILLVPPDRRLPWSFFLMAGLFLLFSSLSLLPAGWVSLPAWRTALETAGLDCGTLISPHPGAVFEHVLLLAGTVVFGLYLTGHTLSGRAAAWLPALFAFGVAAYAVTSILVKETGWTLRWDTQPDFGFFPNRNHTATLLSLGAVCGAAVWFHSARTGHGGRAGLAALSVLICLWALASYNLSRAGLVLTVGGLSIWVAALGRTWLTWRSGALVLGVAAAGVWWFVQSDTGLKARLTAPVATEPEVRSDGADDISRNLTKDGATVDFRVLVYQDTMDMIAHEPWTGSGPGMFRYVFPWHRRLSATSNHSECVHPENDWLMVAAENGLPAALLLGAGVVGLFIRAFRTARAHSSSWPWRAGCLVAAALVPLHGTFDVPGHRNGLVWSAILLLALAMREGSELRNGRAYRVVWRLLGLAMLAGGGSLLVRGFSGTPVLAGDVTAQTVSRAKELFAEDQQIQLANAGKPENSAAAEEPGLLGEAIDLLDRQIRLTPLHAELHYLRGTMLLAYTDKDAEAEKSFLIQRLLDPSWIRLPLRQAVNWIAIDPARAVPLWYDAMERSRRLEEIAPATFMNRSRVFQEIIGQVQATEAASLLAVDLAGQNAGWAATWVQRAHPGALVNGTPKLLQILPRNRGHLFELWAARDQRAAMNWIGELHR